MWFAFNLVSLFYQEHRLPADTWDIEVVICFQFSIFVLSGTPSITNEQTQEVLWFAFNLVSLFYQEHLFSSIASGRQVVICFQFSIFVLSGTPSRNKNRFNNLLWFAFNLVSLFYQEHQIIYYLLYHSILQRKLEIKI